MFKRMLIGVVVLIAAGTVGFYALASNPALAPVAPGSTDRFAQELVERGAMLAGAGNCASCHTSRQDEPYAGGVGFATRFGTVYSTNITPDPGSGIGQWSEAAFARALRSGVARDGSHLYPVFPFDHFTQVTDEDVKALYAFVMTRKSVARAAPDDTLPFPLNVRALQYGWKLLYFKAGEYQPDAGKSARWNRGAYLAEGLAHCSACHTPRNGVGAEIAAAKYTGAIVEGWFAPALDSSNTAPLPWTEEELYAYLRAGGTALHGSAAGSMSDVVHNGLAQLPDADILAIAAYFADVDQSAKFAGNPRDVVAQALRPVSSDERPVDPGAHVYRAACASCHYNSGPMPLAARPELALNNALTAPTPRNFIQVVLRGIGRSEGLPGLMMPGFAAALSDADIARMAAYLRRTRTTLPAWQDVEAEVAAIRKDARGT